MAFQTRHRDPLFDAETQAALERRAQEVMGAGLLAAGAVLVLALGSYTPTDPSFLGTSSEPPANLLGHVGAHLAAPLYVILGAGSWALAVVALAWGLRFVLHRGSERALTRLIFMPLAVALAAVYAATLVPGPGWTHSFGLGGLFGDTALGVLVGVLPVAPGLGLKLAAVGLAAGLLALGLYALGATRAELAGAGRFLWYGLLMALHQTLQALGRFGGGASARVAEGRARRRAAREARAEDVPVPHEAAPAPGLFNASLPAAVRSRPRRGTAR